MINCNTKYVQQRKKEPREGLEVQGNTASKLHKETGHRQR